MQKNILQRHVHSALDFENIANALSIKGIGIPEIATHKLAFDEAARWFAMMKHYRDRIPAKDVVLALGTIANSAERVVRQCSALTISRGQIGEPNTSKHGKQLTRPSPARFNNAVDKLLKKLCVTRDTACDGIPNDLVNTFLQHTSNPKGQTEIDPSFIDDEQTLSDLLEMIADPDCDIEIVAKSASDLTTRARNGIATAKELRSNMIREGYTGDAAINGWIDDMLNLYPKITGRPIGTSTVGPETMGSGEPSGPLIRFLCATGKLVGLKFTDAGWKSRIATARRAHDQKNS